MNSKLDKFEQAIEDNIESWTTVSKNKRASIENIIQKANKKKNVTDQLVDKKNILKSIELLKAQNNPL